MPKYLISLYEITQVAGALEGLANRTPKHDQELHEFLTNLSVRLIEAVGRFNINFSGPAILIEKQKKTNE